MNIGIISHRYSNNYWNGIGRSTHALAQGLKDLAHSVSVYTYNSSDITRKYKDEGVTVINIGGISTTKDKFGIMFEDIPAWNKELYDEMRNEEFDMLVCCDWHGFESCKKYQSKKDVQIIGLVGALANGRGQIVPFSDPKKIREYLALEKTFLDEANCLVAFTEGAQNEVDKITHTTCHLIHLSLPVNEIALAPKDGVVLIQGRIARERCLERGVRAAAELNWVNLTACGSGGESPYGAYIKKLCKKPSIDVNCTFIGWMPDEKIPELYSTAEIVLCPSMYDPFGYSALDAMAFGIAVIGSYESYKGVIEHEQTGLLFQSLSELQEALIRLRQDHVFKAQMIANAKEHLTSKRTVAHSVEQFHNLLINSIYEKVGQEYVQWNN